MFRIDSLGPNRLKLIVFVLLGIVFLGAEFERIGDFYFYHSAAKDLFNGVDIYSNYYGSNNAFLYYGSPALTIMFHPFSWLPLWLSALCWKLIQIFLLWRIWAICEEFLGVIGSNLKWENARFLIVFLTCGFLIYTNFHHLQFTIVLLYTVLEGIRQIFVLRRFAIGGLLIALGFWIKIGPIVLLPYLIYRAQWKGAVSVLAWIFVLGAIPHLLFGHEASGLWNQWVNQIDLFGSEQNFDLNNEKNQGLSALIYTLFLEGVRHSESSVELRRHLFDTSTHIAEVILFTARSGLVALSLFFLRTPPFQMQTQSKLVFIEVAYVALCIPLLFPQQRGYNFLYLMPAIAYIVDSFLRNTWRNSSRAYWRVGFFVIAFLLLNLELYLGEFRRYYWHYKTLTYAALIILGLAVYFRGKEVKDVDPGKI